MEEVLSRGDKYELLSYTTTNPLKGATPKKYMSEAKSIIVLVWDYFQYDFPEKLKKIIGKVYMSSSYTPPLGKIAHSRLQLMKDYLSSNGCVVNSDIGLPARWVGAKSGATTFGKNNFAYVDDAGSYIVISTIVVDKELEYDKPSMETKCPPNCRICIDACPTKAIYEPFKLDPRRCISFNNWTTQDGRGSISSFIPYELRELIGNKIHGCDICQDVCPRNQKKLKSPKPMDKYIELVGTEITLPAILNMTDEYFNYRIRPILYNYIKDKKYLIRNAAIAMGNSRDESFIEDLEVALTNPDEMIKEYVAWALGKIGGSDSAKVLLNRYPKESSETVKRAIGKALNRIQMSQEV